VAARGYFISTSWNGSAVAQAFLSLARALTARGHRVVILADREPPTGEGPRSSPAVHVWPDRRPVRPRDAAFLARLIRRERPDALIANFGAANVMTLVGLALRVPVRLCWYHSVFAATAGDARIGRWRVEAHRLRKSLVYRAATHVVANSRAGALDVQRHYAVPAAKVAVVYNSLADPRPAVAPARDAKKLVCVGRFSPSKGQHTLIRALALLADRGAHLALVGDGECRAELTALAAQLGVAHRCAFLGQLAGPEVAAQLASAAIAVVPSLAESFGLVNVEAMAVATPLVVSATGGIVEVVRDGQEGLHVPPGDAPALARALDRLLADPALRDALGQRGRARFVSTFEQGRAAEATADWLAALVDGAAR
jgi:glycosyltransferase involved in cell wall biosynthesis